MPNSFSAVVDIENTGDIKDKLNKLLTKSDVLKNISVDLVEDQERQDKLLLKIEALKNISSDLVKKLQDRKMFCQEAVLRIGELNDSFIKK